MEDQSTSKFFLSPEDSSLWEDVESTNTGGELSAYGSSDFDFNPNWHTASELWIIDCRPELFTTIEIVDGSESNWWQEFMNMALENMKRKVISHPRCRFGILAFNTKYFLNGMGVPGIYTILDFDTLTPQRIKRISADSNLSWKEFQSKYGGIDLELVSLADVFWVTNNILCKKENANKKRYNCQVSLFTSCDDPCKNEASAIINRAEDIRKNYASIQLFSFEIPGFSFDISKFYIDLLKVDYDEIEEYKIFSKLRLENLKHKIRKKLPQRITGLRQTLNISDKMKIAVICSIHIMEQKVPTPKLVDPETLLPMKKEIIWKSESTGKPIDPADIIYTVPFGNEEIILSQQKMMELRDNGEPFMKLIGFVPIDSIKFHLNITHSYFVTPDDTKIAGSSKLFSAFHQSMFLQRMAAIVDWLPERGTLLRQAALISQMEVLDAYETQIEPAGFNLIKLPYIEEIRSIAPETLIKINELYQESTTDQDKINANKAEAVLMSYFDPNYDPRNYSNPSLARHFAYLEALALDLEDFELAPNAFMDDKSDEDQEKIKLIIDWKDSVNRTYPEKPIEITPNKKRSQHSMEQKKVDESLVKELYHEDNLSKLTVAQLKDFLSSQSSTVKGNKKDLIELIKKMFDKDPGK